MNIYKQQTNTGGSSLASSVHEEEVDVIVVGAGPAGMSTAITLAQQGYQVTVLEKMDALPLRVGECLPSKGAACLEPLGLKQTFLNAQHPALQGYQVSWGMGGSYERHLIHSSYGTGWLLDRVVFDRMLLEQAIKLGVDVRFGMRIVGLDQLSCQEWAWHVMTESGGKSEQATLKAKVLVDASGRARSVVKRLDIPQAKSDALVASVCYLQHDPNTANLPYLVHIVSDENGWWYSAPLSKATSVLMYFTDSDLSLPKYAEQQLMLAQVIDGFEERFSSDKVSVISGSFRRVAAYSSALSQCAGQGWIAVGDAACSYDPLSSYGITSALGSGYYGGLAMGEFLSGQSDGLETYQGLMQSTFMAFLDKQAQEYRHVTQFKGAFWQRRQQSQSFKVG